MSQLCAAIDWSQKAIRSGVVKIAIITSGHKNRNRWGEWMKVVGGRPKLPRLRNPNQSAGHGRHSPAAAVPLALYPAPAHCLPKFADLWRGHSNFEVRLCALFVVPAAPAAALSSLWECCGRQYPWVMSL